jgi:hypothetical protein
MVLLLVPCSFGRSYLRFGQALVVVQAFVGSGVRLVPGHGRRGSVMALGPGSKYRVAVVGEAVVVGAGIEETGAGNVFDLEDEQQQIGQ